MLKSLDAENGGGSNDARDDGCSGELHLDI